MLTLLLPRLLWCCSAVGCAIVVAACAPGLDDTKSLTALKSANEGVVFIQLYYAGMPCMNGNILLATEPSPGRYEKYTIMMVGGLASDAALGLALEKPNSISCRPTISPMPQRSRFATSAPIQ